MPAVLSKHSHNRKRTVVRPPGEVTNQQLNETVNNAITDTSNNRARFG